MRTGIASFTLDYGKCPRWLFRQMVRLGKVVGTAIIQEFGTREFLRRLSDPVWFQSLGMVMARPTQFDQLLLTPGVGPKTICALSLVAGLSSFS